jgi:hypothetical protein
MPTDYLNEFHKRLSERNKAIASRQRKRSLAEAMQQYDEVKRESVRSSRERKGRQPTTH